MGRRILSTRGDVERSDEKAALVKTNFPLSAAESIPLGNRDKPSLRLKLVSRSSGNDVTVQPITAELKVLLGVLMRRHRLPSKAKARL
jgi:hypothetical protein